VASSSSSSSFIYATRIEDIESAIHVTQHDDNISDSLSLSIEKLLLEGEEEENSFKIQRLCVRDCKRFSALMRLLGVI
jgi:hypothetical protein